MSLPALPMNPLRLHGTAIRLRLAALTLLAAGTMIAASPLQAQQPASDNAVAAHAQRVGTGSPTVAPVTVQDDRLLPGQPALWGVAVPAPRTHSVPATRRDEAVGTADRTFAAGPLAVAPAVRYTPVSRPPLPEERQDDNSSTVRRHLALIGVGVGAILIGSELVDGGSGTVLVLGGAGLSLYGLYQILK